MAFGYPYAVKYFNPVSGAAAAFLVSVAIAMLTTPVSAQTAPAIDRADTADPKSVGMSADRLKRVADFLAAEVATGNLPGVVVAVARRGKTVFLQAHGHRDDETGEALPVDAIFDLSTLSKPVTAVGAMLLHERGHWLLSDPLGTYLTEFGSRRITILDLLRESSGLADALPLTLIAKSSGKKTGKETRGSRSGALSVRHSLAAASQLTGKEFTVALAKAGLVRPVGLVAAPGFEYDALGLAIEAASKQTLGTWLLREIFIPLDLWDTGFNPSSSAVARLARPPANAGLDARAITGWAPVRDLTSAVSFECGGACLSSTAGNYLRFIQMLLNNGSLDGKRILSRASVRFMTTDRLKGRIENRIGSPDESGVQGESEFGYGLGVAVRPATAVNALPGSPGEFSAAAPTGPYFWADPTEELAVVMLAMVPEPARRLRLQRSLRALVRQAIDD